MDLLVRLIVAVAFLALVLGAVAAARWWYRRRLAGHVGERAGNIAAHYGLSLERPSILFLSTPRCIECRELQEPALARLAASLAVDVRKLNAPDVPDLTKRFGIISVPATIVIDAGHRIRGVNVGFADTEQLATQLA